MSTPHKCPVCCGTGRLWKYGDSTAVGVVACDACGGSGVVWEPGPLVVWQEGVAAAPTPVEKPRCETCDLWALMPDDKKETCHLSTQEDTGDGSLVRRPDAVGSWDITPELTVTVHKDGRVTWNPGHWTAYEVGRKVAERIDAIKSRLADLKAVLAEVVRAGGEG